MKRSSTGSKKLVLSKETLRALGDRDLSRAKGGASLEDCIAVVQSLHNCIMTASCRCNSDTCF